MKRIVFLSLLACSVAGPASANSTVTLQDREQAACYNDVQTLCGDFVPDVDATGDCMLKKRAQVSAPCAKFFPDAKPAG